MTPSSLQTLIDAMSDGNHLRLVDHEIAGLLGWMAGSSRTREARALHSAFGEAGQDQRVTERGFRLLDHALFSDQSLLEEIAGVGSDRSNDERRRRYRLLLSAFHPDRDPNRSEWLTQRSQAITSAYSRFKSGKGAQRLEPAARPGPMTVRKPRPMLQPRLRPRLIRPSKRWLTSVIRGIRQRFGGDPWLAQKIIGGFALVLILPLLSVLLDTESPRATDADQGQAAMAIQAQSPIPQPDPQGQPLAGLEDGPSADRTPNANPDRVDQAVDLRSTAKTAQSKEAIEVMERPAVQLVSNARPSESGTGDRQRAGSETDAASTARTEDSRAMGSESRPTRQPSTAERDVQALAARQDQSPRNEAPGPQTGSNAAQGQAPEFTGRESRATPALAMNRAASRPNDQPDPSEGSAASAGGIDPPSNRVPDKRAVARSVGPEPSAAMGHALTDSPPTPSSDPQTAIARSDHRPDPPPDPPPVARGRLRLGPLGTHQIGALLQQYQLALEYADIETLGELVGPENLKELLGMFPYLFESSQQHRVDLRILQSQRDGNQWVVQLQQEVGVSAIDRRARNFSHRAEFRFSPDPEAIRIVAVDF